MNLLSGFGPRPSRPRWRSRDARRSTPQPFRPEAERRTADNRVSCLARNGGLSRQGKKVGRPPLRLQAIEASAVLRPDTPKRGGVGRGLKRTEGDPWRPPDTLPAGEQRRTRSGTLNSWRMAVHPTKRTEKPRGRCFAFSSRWRLPGTGSQEAIRPRTRLPFRSYRPDRGTLFEASGGHTRLPVTCLAERHAPAGRLDLERGIRAGTVASCVRDQAPGRKRSPSGSGAAEEPGPKGDAHHRPL